MKTTPVIERAISHDREYGKFIVICRNGAAQFNSLIGGFLFYFKLDIPATLGDITEEAELLEKKEWIHGYSNNLHSQ